MLPFSDEIEPTFTTILAHAKEVEEEVENVAILSCPDNPFNYDATKKVNEVLAPKNLWQIKKSVQTK